MTPTILLLGKNGQVGKALHGLLAKYPAVIAHDRSSCDLSSPRALRTVIQAARPAIIINAAAYTGVDLAENDEITCRKVNAVAPEIIAEEARRQRALLVHFSTDYVFDGSKRDAYSESDEPRPLNAYGRSKLEGDLAVLQAGGDHIVLRVAWVFSATGRNFAKTILRLSNERDELSIVDDQFGAPSSANMIAEVTSQIVDRYVAADGLPSGVYHLAPAGRTSWHGFAIELVSQARQQGLKLRINSKRITPICSSSYPLPAARPANSSFDTRKLQNALNITLRDWRAYVRPVVTELAADCLPA